jgi:aconitase A
MPKSDRCRWPGPTMTLTDGAVAIAAITSCTNTSNPSVMIGAGSGGPQGPRQRAVREALGEDLPGPR